MTEEIIGMDTGRDQAARLMNHFIPNKWLAIEAALYRGKWFDYRFLNPVQATCLYAHEYTKAFKVAFARNIETARAEHVKPLKNGDLFACSRPVISGIWRGRMVADAMGIPYNIYLERAFHWTLRYWQQKHLPRPHQLYSDLVTDRLVPDWEERCRDDFFYSTLPQYANAHYAEALATIGNDERLEGTALHSQNAHHEWILEQCKDRRNGHAILAQMVFHDRVLPLDKVRARLDDNGFERVLSFAESKPVVERYN